MFALVLPMLLGMVGLVIDCGLLMVAQREAQNAADAAAMAAAMAELTQQGDPRSVATTFVTSYNGLSVATVSSFNHPPAAGPHAADDRFFEVVVTYPITTLFMPALGTSRNQSVQARAVAGIEPVSAGAGVAVLDPTASPGLRVAEGASLVVNGRITVNSSAQPAADYRRRPGRGRRLSGRGPDRFRQFPALPGYERSPRAQPLARVRPLDQPPDTRSHTQYGLRYRQSPRYRMEYPDAGQSVGAGHASDRAPGPKLCRCQWDRTAFPGHLSGDHGYRRRAEFQPRRLHPEPIEQPALRPRCHGWDRHGCGGDVLQHRGKFHCRARAPPTTATQLSIRPAPRARTLRHPRRGSRPTSPASGSTGQRMRTSRCLPLSDSGDPFSGMLIYQRRANTRPIVITGGNLALSGTIYAVWAPLVFSGGGTYQAQFIVGSMRLSGNRHTHALKLRGVW